jgi:cytoskeletal protein CcmA (bactofilin family)
MATSFVNIGVTANDGTGDPIRTAFDTVNDNFDIINGALFAGTQSSIISAVSVNGGYFISNSYVEADTYVSADNLIGNTVVSNGNLFVSQDGAYIVGNVTIVGNLNVSGSQAASQSQQSGSPILSLHYSATPLITDDGKDIGTSWQYYKGAEKKAFLGWQNSTGTLIYQDNITDTANVITAGTFGNVQFGSLMLSNTTASTSNVTGALQVKGGVGVQGNLYVQSNVFVGTEANVANLTVRGFHVGSLNFAGADTIYINGSPVVTSATSFNGGTVNLDTAFTSATQSTSTTTGAVKLSGGLGVVGNIWGGNINVHNSGSFRGNIIGNILTPSQPFVTSVGPLISLNMDGQINAQNIIPEVNNFYELGGSSNRWNQIYAFNIDTSGTISGATINSTGGTHTGNIAINTATAAALTTNTTVAELFNSGATTVRIAAAGVTEFRNNTQATSTTTGAIQLTGGMSIATGQLRIGGASGRSITATGNVVINGNAQATSTTTGVLVATGGLGINTGNVYIGGSGGNAIVHTGNIIPTANLAFDIGTSTAWYNTFYGKSIQAQYADLAERYVADAEYNVGTVLVFGGKQEVTVTTKFADHRVAGVVSGQPAYLMNAVAPGIAVALRGRVPVKVIGPVHKGDLLVTSDLEGHAVSVGGDTSHGIKIFAKSLETNGELGEKIIEAVIL